MGVCAEVAAPRPGLAAGEGRTCAVGVGSETIDAGVIGGLLTDIGQGVWLSTRGKRDRVQNQGEKFEICVYDRRLW